MRLPFRPENLPKRQTSCWPPPPHCLLSFNETQMSVFASNRKDDFPSHWPSGMAVEFEPPQRPVRAGPPSSWSTFLAVVCNYFNTIRHQTHKHTLTHTHGTYQKPFSHTILSCPVNRKNPSLHSREPHLVRRPSWSAVPLACRRMHFVRKIMKAPVNAF